jgi:hypothetical protein
MWIDLVFLIVVLIIAAMAAVGIRAYVLTEMAKDRREKELREWARGHGFAYSATEALMSFRCQPFQCLQKGDYCDSFNVIEGTSGNRPLRAFDYHYYSETEARQGQGPSLLLSRGYRGRHTTTPPRHTPQGPTG